VESFFGRKVSGNLTAAELILKKLHLGHPRLLAFMNQEFGFSGSRDVKLKKYSRCSWEKLLKKVIHSCTKKRHNTKIKSAQNADTLICTIIAQLLGRAETF
jgi:hypothetical protein